MTLLSLPLRMLPDTEDFPQWTFASRRYVHAQFTFGFRYQDLIYVQISSSKPEHWTSVVSDFYWKLSLTFSFSSEFCQCLRHPWLDRRQNLEKHPCNLCLLSLAFVLPSSSRPCRRSLTQLGSKSVFRPAPALVEASRQRCTSWSRSSSQKRLFIHM